MKINENSEIHKEGLALFVKLEILLQEFRVKFNDEKPELVYLYIESALMGRVTYNIDASFKNLTDRIEYANQMHLKLVYLLEQLAEKNKSHDS